MGREPRALESSCVVDATRAHRLAKNNAVIRDVEGIPIERRNPNSRPDTRVNRNERANWASLEPHAQRHRNTPLLHILLTM